MHYVLCCYYLTSGNKRNPNANEPEYTSKQTELGCNTLNTSGKWESEYMPMISTHENNEELSWDGCV